MAIFLHLLLIVLSVLGMADAGYLSYEKLANVTPPCINAPGFDCGSVLNSPWAMLGPLPLPVWGLMFYTTFFVLSVLIFLFPSVPKFVKWFWRLLSFFGFLFSGYLMFIMFVLIGKLCIYCLLSALTCLSLFLVHTLYFWIVGRQSKSKIVASSSRHTRAYDDLDDEV
jgi:uncharacterized membrane protein